jgi:integrase
MKLGNYGPAFTVEMARREAVRIAGLVAGGGDPAGEKQQARLKRLEQETLADAVERYIEIYARPNLKSWEETARVLRRNIVPDFGAKPVGDVTRTDILRLLDRMIANPTKARHTLAWTKGLFTWLVERGELAVNPAAGLSLPKGEARERTLSDDEVRDVLQAAELVGWPWGPLVRLLLLTGQRRGEVSGMAWEEINGAVWTIPGQRTKNGRPHAVPLSVAVQEEVARIPRLADCPWVFSTSGKSPLSGFSKGKTRLDKAIDELRAASARPAMPDWTFHDLRRTAATGMTRLGISPTLVERILNHSEKTGLSAVASVYDKYSYLPEMAAALETWSAAINQVMSGNASEKNRVIPFRRA